MYSILGGTAYHSTQKGLGCFNSECGVNLANSDFAFLGCATKEIAKHKPLGWIKDTSTICNIINIQKTEIFIYDGIANRYLNFINVFNLKFADGTPFGIKE